MRWKNRTTTPNVSLSHAGAVASRSTGGAYEKEHFSIAIRNLIKRMAHAVIRR